MSRKDFIYTTVLILVLLVGVRELYGQTIIKPGGSVNMMCTSCPTAPTRLPDVKVVDPSGNGDYTTVKDAAGNAQPGLTILVKNGTYNRRIIFNTSGTSGSPIILKPYPGHSPVLDFTGSPDETPRVEIKADYIVVDGFEIRNGWDGVKIYGDNNIIRNNYIHDNDYQGILAVGANNSLVEHNRIAENGVGGNCIMEGVNSPRHCHGIYYSNYLCGGAPSNNITKHNHISGHAGAAIQFNGYSEGACANHASGNAIENNKIENNATGMYIYHSFDNNTIKNNEFIVNSYPTTNETSPAMLSIWDSKTNTIESNIFYSTHSSVHALEVYDTETAENNTVNNNLWKVQNAWWVWGGTWREDWPKYQRVTGWDADGEVTVAVSE